MKTKLSLAVALAALLVTTGCASRNTASGGRETSVLAGAVTVATNSFQPVSPTTFSLDTTQISGSGGPTGQKVTFLWGLITLHDY